MTSPDDGSGGEYVLPDEVRRVLPATVDAIKLERLLGSVDAEARSAILQICLSGQTSPAGRWLPSDLASALDHHDVSLGSLDTLVFDDDASSALLEAVVQPLREYYRIRLKADLEALWAEHSRTASPLDPNSELANAQSLSQLDTDISALVSSFLSGDGIATNEEIKSRAHSLMVRAHDAAKQLSGESRRYFARLKALAGLIFLHSARF